MRLRVSRELHRLMKRVAGVCGFEDANIEVTRRALKQYRSALARGERVALAEFATGTTRGTSTALRLEVDPELVGSLKPAEVRAVINWACWRAEKRTLAAPSPFNPPPVKYVEVKSE